MPQVFYLCGDVTQQVAQHHSATCSLSPDGMAERIGTVRLQEPTGWEKEGWVDYGWLCKTKATRTSKARNSHASFHQQADVQSLSEKQDLSHINSFLERQTASLTSSSFTTPFIAKHDAMWYGKSVWPDWVSCPGCIPFQLPVHPQAPLMAGQHEELKCPWFYAELLYKNQITGVISILICCVVFVFFSPKYKIQHHISIYEEN